jgi:hypothetical protein
MNRAAEQARIRGKIAPATFDEVLTKLRSLQFDVREEPGVAGGYRVSKHGCAAVIAKAKNGKGVVLVRKPGAVLGGEIAYLLDRGNQKFLKTSNLEIAATADRLKAEHQLSEELRAVIGEPVLYNEALGTVSDEYMYDRVQGRPGADGPPRGAAPWNLTEGAPDGH